MNIEEKLKATLKQIDEKRSKVSTMSAEFRSMVEKADSEDELKEAQEKRSAIDAINAEIKTLEEQRDLYQAAIEGNKEPASRNVNPSVETSEREKINAAIRSMDLSREIHIPAEILRAASDNPQTTGQVSSDNELLIPKQQSFVPQRQPKTVVDLKPFVTTIKVTTASGTQPILKHASGVLHTVEELAKNPELSKPEFENVDWKVKTYRGAIAISQENIDDSAVDLVGIIAEQGNQLKVNTQNAEVAKVFKLFPKKTIESLDDLKEINNVELDPAYARALIASQSFYHYLDTLKDGEGRYLLKDDITSASGKSVLGMPIEVLADDSLGTKKGDMVAFLGDSKLAALLADRADLDVQWVDHDIYGKYLRAGLRFDVEKADENSGFYLEFVPKA